MLGSNDIVIEFDGGKKRFLPKAQHNVSGAEAFRFWQERKRAGELLNQAIENKEVENQAYNQAHSRHN